MEGEKLDSKNYKFTSREELEKKVNTRPEMPENIFDAVNSKIPQNYMPGLEFAHVSSGLKARERLIKMFPHNKTEIRGFKAKQAMFFYYTIRKKYG